MSERPAHQPGEEGILQAERVLQGEEVGDDVAVGGRLWRIEAEAVVVGAAGERIDANSAGQRIVAIEPAQDVVADAHLSTCSGRHRP